MKNNDPIFLTIYGLLLGFICFFCSNISFFLIFMRYFVGFDIHEDEQSKRVRLYVMKLFKRYNEEKKKRKENNGKLFD